MQEFIYERKPENKRPVIGKLLSLLLAVLVLLIASFLFVNSSYFNVGKVTIEGNKYISNEEIYRIAQIPEPINILKLNTSEVRDKLKRDLRIANVDVVRKFPSTIAITIRERQPLAYVASGYGFVEIDSQGVILAAYKNIKQINVPMITGIKLESGYIGDNVANDQMKPILEYLSKLEEPILNQISEVNIQAGGNIICYTVNSSQLKLGKAERMGEKAQLTNEILYELSNKGVAVDYVDLIYTSPFIKFKQ